MRPKISNAVIVVMFWSASISGVCLAQEKKNEREKPLDRKVLDGDVTIQVKVAHIDGNRVRVHGETNLPSGMKLTLSVDENLSGGLSVGGAQLSVSDDGSFRSDLVGPAKGLEDGLYVAEIATLFPGVQPKHVQAIIGAKGDKLTGRLVTHDDVGATVFAACDFTIGGEQASARQRARTVARVEQYGEWLNKVVALHKRVQTARQLIGFQENPNAAIRARRDQFTREFNQELTSHEEALKELWPKTSHMILGTSLGQIGRMIRAVTFQNSKDYAVASADYSRDVKELQEFVTEAEEAIWWSGIATVKDVAAKPAAQAKLQQPQREKENEFLPANSNRRKVTKKEFGEKWPLTVDEGEIECIQESAKVTIRLFHHGQKTYSLNGIAQSRGYPPIDPIWKNDRKLGAGFKISMHPLNEIADKICNEAPPKLANQNPKPNDQTIEAYTAAQIFVQRQLKSPSTASYGGLFSGDLQDPRECVKSLGNGEYKVKGWVDSQNSFGATVRTDFELTVKDHGDGNNWSLVGKLIMRQR